ncbi:MAG: hypothetical protein LUD83_05360 [Clostridiales bacterium]|nr:hypothetical protein [Clostridiales bacterium]
MVWSEIFDYDGLIEIIAMLSTLIAIFPSKYSRKRTVLTAVGYGAAFFLCNTAVIVGNELSGFVFDTIRFNLYALLMIASGFCFSLHCLKGYWQ